MYWVLMPYTGQGTVKWIIDQIDFVYEDIETTYKGRDEMRWMIFSLASVYPGWLGSRIVDF